MAWGYYDANAAPVLRVKSGETMETQTPITSSPKLLEESMLRVAMEDVDGDVGPEFAEGVRERVAAQRVSVFLA